MESEKRAIKEALKQKSEQVSNQIEEEEKAMIVKKTEENLKRKASEKLLNEANKQLKEGLRKKDFSEVQVAQILVDQYNKAKAEGEKLGKDVQDLNKVIHRKKEN